MVPLEHKPHETEGLTVISTWRHHNHHLHKEGHHQRSLDNCSYNRFSHGGCGGGCCSSTTPNCSLPEQAVAAHFSLKKSALVATANLSLSPPPPSSSSSSSCQPLSSIAVVSPSMTNTPMSSSDQEVEGGSKSRRTSPFPEEWGVASEWWASRLVFIGGFNNVSSSSPQGSFDGTLISAGGNALLPPSTPMKLSSNFKTALLAQIAKKFADHWYPEAPLKGSAFRSISFSVRMDPLLKKAGESIGLQNLEKMLLSARNCTMFVNPGEVVIRQGRDNVYVLYKSDGRSSSTEEQPEDQDQLASVFLKGKSLEDEFVLSERIMSSSGERSDGQSCKESSAAASGNVAGALSSHTLMSM
eukprot:TRINITY_DN4175_c0_g2_i1.p1 TRINITY_DN4175_c0_g2~~TRINITY_DN4175_c0_g2_i1.p1  ORF type:complete len:356 (+),score=54.82 TRINITY_DN4175_c0_g2_i1:213-1280(+)